MAEQHHKPGTRTATTAAHYYKVGYRPNRGQPNPLPQLTIKGRWLEALGFTTGQKIEVIPEAGQLIIRLAEE
ncbi:type I toxin-antitoxin system SymE family toxin [Pantoea allii]|nr:SymE family type I addiction module toxin [Pantoea allii]THB82512.1 type I toxin-antitoxin system SymE family toxin [Pantoea allii]